MAQRWINHRLIVMQEKIPEDSKDYARLRSWYLARLRRAQLTEEQESIKLNPTLLLEADNSRLREISKLNEVSQVHEALNAQSRRWKNGVRRERLLSELAVLSCWFISFVWAAGTWISLSPMRTERLFCATLAIVCLVASLLYLVRCLLIFYGSVEKV